jgi:demethylmenaquinone methyltransferase/2-methoxy-6-polyprenyl-1,4-benzoquinol methylase
VELKSSHKGPEAQKVQSIFSSVAPKYDLANQVLSFGVHHMWRRKLVNWSNATTGDNILDCATGTGDLAIEFKKIVGPTGSVIGTDFSKEMLSFAPQKSQKLGLDIQFEWADVTALPYEAAKFNSVSISFGIRNVNDPEKALREMARVTKPGGTVMVLEFGQSKLPIFSSLYNWYSSNVLPKVGGLVTGDRSAYEYLQTSSAHFPCGVQFVELMKKTEAFKDVEFKSLTGGIAYLYKGVVK